MKIRKGGGIIKVNKYITLFFNLVSIGYIVIPLLIFIGIPIPFNLLIVSPDIKLIVSHFQFSPPRVPASVMRDISLWPILLSIIGGLSGLTSIKLIQKRKIIGLSILAVLLFYFAVIITTFSWFVAIMALPAARLAFLISAVVNTLWTILYIVLFIKLYRNF